MTASNPLPALRGQDYARLSLLAFLFFAALGAIVSVIMPLLVVGFDLSGSEIGGAFLVFGGAASFAPFVGKWADRSGHYGRLLAMLGAVAAVALLGVVASTQVWNLLVFAALAAFALTSALALLNATVLAVTPDRDRDYSVIRVWGSFGLLFAGVATALYLDVRYSPTAGEHAAALASGATQLEDYALYRRAAIRGGLPDAFALAAVFIALFSLASLTLIGRPTRFVATDPVPTSNTRRNAKQMWALAGAGLLLSAVHHTLLIHINLAAMVDVLASDLTGRGMIAGGRSFVAVAWMSEAIALGILPFVLKSVVRKKVLMIGAGAYSLGAAIFLFGGVSLASNMAIAVLHGVSFAFFITAGLLVVDEMTPVTARATAQGWVHVVLLGGGLGLGGLIASLGLDARSYTPSSGITFLPVVAVLVGLAVLWSLYPRIERTRPAI